MRAMVTVMQCNENVSIYTIITYKSEQGLGEV